MRPASIFSNIQLSNFRVLTKTVAIYEILELSGKYGL